MVFEDSLISANESLLIRRAQGGDRAAFDEIVERHWSPLMLFAKGRLGRTEDAEDAVLKGMLKAYRAISGFDESRPLRPWLIAIVGNCCTDTIRRRRDEVAFPLNFEEFRAGADNTAEEVEGTHFDAAARAAIAALPRHYAEVMTLRVLEDLPVEEIAAKLNRPIGTIKSWLFRARALLAKSLGPRLAA